MSENSKTNACFVEDLKPVHRENAQIQSVNKMLFTRNIKAISSANFIFFEALNLQC